MQTARNIHELYEQLRTRAVPFLVVFFLIMFVSYLFLMAIDFTPDPIQKAKESTQTSQEASTVDDDGAFGFFDVLRTVWAGKQTDTNERVGVARSADAQTIDTHNGATLTHGADATPERLIIDKLDRDVTVLNPDSANVATMDKALLKGVVRHPNSADFTDEGNMLIFGHSSYLPNVFNKNFQALNGIQNLTWGDLIRLQSNDTEYTYRVEKVYEAKATDLVVPNSRGEAKLTLATCDVLGAKEDRFVVEAVLIETKAL